MSDALATLQFGVAPALATALLQSLWQDTLLALGAACALAALSRASAALRHTIAMVFLLAMVALPVAGFAGFWKQAPGAINGGWLPAFTPVAAHATHGALVRQSNPLTAALSLLWLAGVGVMLLRRFGGWRLVIALDRRPFAPLPAEWQSRVDALRCAFGITRRVAVRVSTQVLTPFTARVLRPVVWLPVALLAQLPREQVEALLAHELAHIARLDWLWNGVQCVVEALLFFHPAAWWLGRRIRIEREHACDDRAVAACGDAIALAEALARLERQRLPIPRLVLAAQGGSLMQRITRLLSPSSQPPTRSRWAARAGVVVVLAAGSLVVAQLAIGGARPSIRINATTDGALGAGDSREIIANGIDKQRTYRAEKDAQGRLTEVYKEDGVARPINADVRRWLAEVTRLSAPPPPPAPPAPPPPPAALQPPPPPPPPPAITDSAEFHALFRQLATDPRIVAALGTPVAMASQAFDGHMYLGDADGDTDARLEVRGPKGHATVHVVARRADGAWTVDTADIVGPVR